MLIRYALFLTAIVTSLSIIGCAPSVSLIDRQTVLELEASGDWQELDKTYRNQELQSGPVPLQKMQEKVERRPVLSMTHGDDATVNDSNSKKKGQ